MTDPSLTAVLYRGMQTYAAEQVGHILGYCNDRGVMRTVKRLPQGSHWVAAAPSDIEGLVKQFQLPLRKRQEFILLTDDGLLGVLMKTKSPKAKEILARLDIERESRAARSEVTQKAAAMDAPPASHPVSKPRPDMEAMQAMASVLAPVVASAVTTAMQPLVNALIERLPAQAPVAVQPAKPPALPAVALRKKLNRLISDDATEYLASRISSLDEAYRPRLKQEIRDRWHQLDKALYDRCGVDLPARARHAGMDRLDCAAITPIPAKVGREGMLIDLMYELAREMFKGRSP